MYVRTSFLLALGAILITGAVASASFYAFVQIGFPYCGGDGGSPYADPASTRGHLCAIAGPLLPLTFPGTPLLVAAAAVFATKRRRPWVFAIAVVTALAFAGLEIAALAAASPTP
ncbi:MAG TPA: hypothetical protein VNT55_04385 [Baekduia sp.]|nr:hypothetical protein [Baekduia sp.]